MRRNALALAAVVAAVIPGCRALQTTRPPSTAWTRGARVLVVARPMEMPLFPQIGPLASPEADQQVAEMVADGLGGVRGVEVLPRPPGAQPVGKSDAVLCQAGRSAGAEYVVAAGAHVTAEHKIDCLVTNNLIRHLVVPIPVLRLPLASSRVDMAHVELDEEKCLVTTDNGWDWSKAARADVIATTDCSRTGGTLYAATAGSSRAVPDGMVEVLRADIRRDAADLFPRQVEIERVDGDRAVVDGAGLDSGDVFDVHRPGAAPEDRWACVRSVDGGRAAVEPYASSDDLEPGDVLVARGRLRWIELAPYAAASQLTVGGERLLTVGGGGRLRYKLGPALLGFGLEVLPLSDTAARERVDTVGNLNFGVEGGLVHHATRRLDLYALLSAGVSIGFADADPPEDPAAPSNRVGGAAYGGAALGAKLTLFRRLFVDAELGGLYSTPYDTGSAHARVTQRAPFVRASLGVNLWH